MIIDAHCHYTLTALRARGGDRFSFEPAVRDGEPTYDSCVSPRAIGRPTWWFLGRALGVRARMRPGDAVDAELSESYARHLLAPGPVERYVLLAFDWYHDDAGRRPPLPDSSSARGSDIYTSNTLIRDLCRRHPDRYLFGASVHPYRENAVACIDEVFAAGACLLKWLPLHQNIDIHDRRSLAVLRRCAELGLPLLAHYGEEFTLATQHPEHEPVAVLLSALRRLRREGAMPKTIVAHAATPISVFGDTASPRLLFDAMRGEFAEAPLYADISALTAFGKLGFLKPLAAMQDLHPRLLFGSDFPVPIADPLLRWSLGTAYRALRAEPSWPQRVAKICRHVGFNEIVFHRAAELLPHTRVASA